MDNAKTSTSPTRPRYSARSLLRRLGPAGIMTLLAASLPFLGTAAVAYVGLRLHSWLVEHGLLGLAIYIVTFWILGGLAIIPTWVQSGLGGWTFGFALGLPAALVSYAGASLFGYAIARRFSGDRVTQLIAENRKWLAVYNALLKSGFWRTLTIVTLIRIPPSSPFAVTNVVMAATRVPTIPFVIGIILGIAPRTAAVVYATHRAQGLTFQDGHEVMFFLLGLAAMAGAIVLMVYFARRALAHMTETCEGKESAVGKVNL